MDLQTQAKNLSYHLSQLEDPRMDRRKEHSLHDVLMISIMAMLCGAESFVDFEDFGKAKEEWLREFLQLPGGIPSHDTFGRVFALMDQEAFAESFRNWTEGLRRKVSAEIVAIDGKTLRRSHDRLSGKSAIHMVSAWGRENGLVLGQVKVDEKSNEITAVPELLRNLELAGCIVTIDAMGTQKKIAGEIRDADADYVLALKGNHETALEEVSSFLLDAKSRENFGGVAHDFFETLEKDHGRIETRRYWITEKSDWFTDKALWDGLRSFGMVESEREIDGKKTVETRFYLASIPACAKEFARAVRGHWSVENSLHWCLDVCFGEDQCRSRIGNASENLAILRHITLNILKRDSSKKRGIRGKQKNASWDHSYLIKLLDF
jgi:predicted transposase YbfD/YdcC